MKAKPPDDDAVIREAKALFAKREAIEPPNAWTLNAVGSSGAQVNFAHAAQLSNTYNAADVLRQAKGAK